MSTVNYEDIYEEFLLLSSSSSAPASSSSQLQTPNNPSRRKFRKDFQVSSEISKEGNNNNSQIRQIFSNLQHKKQLNPVIIPVRQFQNINMGAEGEESISATIVDTTTATNITTSPPHTTAEENSGNNGKSMNSPVTSSNSSIITSYSRQQLDNKKQFIGEKRFESTSSIPTGSGGCSSSPESSLHGPPPNKRLSMGDREVSSVINMGGGSSGETNQNQPSSMGEVHRSTCQSLAHRNVGLTGSNPGNENLQGNRQQNTLAYYPYGQEFQYPSPHFLIGGCIQQASQVPTHMHHHTGWLQQGQNIHNNSIPDHNYNVNMIHTNNNNPNTNLILNNNNTNQALTTTHHQQQQQSNQQSSTPQYAINSSSTSFNHPPYTMSNSAQNCQQQSLSTTSLQGQMVSGMTSRTPWGMSNESLYPGGLEVLWREREMTEEVKKLMNMQDVPDSARMRGYFTVCELVALKKTLLGRFNSQNIREDSSTGTTGSGHQDTPSNASMVGMAVKEAMHTLDDYQNHSDASSVVKAEYNRGNGNQGSKTAQGLSSGTSTVSSACGSSSTVTTIGISTPGNNSNIGPPPPYRTATLVFKLLQIGNYQFRSFSEINPNKLRVLFNTQRLTYECQLALVRPPKEGMQLLRKLLTVDIGFEQISMIRFGTDKLFLRVEGAPLLTVTYNPANDDTTCPTLTQQDHYLLEQIDKGQLKLSPCHQLYFLNERLVHVLEAQFREHPRFRHMLQDSYHYLEWHQHQNNNITSQIN